MIAYILLDVAKVIYIPHEYWIDSTQAILKAAGFYCHLVNGWLGASKSLPAGLMIMVAKRVPPCGFIQQNHGDQPVRGLEIRCFIRKWSIKLCT